MSDVLEQEMATYARLKNELLANHRGRFVLIAGDQFVGAFDTEQDAIREGYRLLGNVPFLVKRVVDVEVPERFVSNLIAF